MNRMLSESPNEKKQQNSATIDQRLTHIFEQSYINQIVQKSHILQIVGLFYENNQEFIRIFQHCYLTIFKSLQSNRSNSLKSLNTLNYSNNNNFQYTTVFIELISLFIYQLINMQYQIKIPQQKGQYFENFLDYLTQFLIDGLYSASKQIRQYSNQIIHTVFKIIQRSLQIQFLQQTVQKIINVIIYLLTSKKQQNIKISIQLYGICKKIHIKSEQIQQLMFQLIQTYQNYSIRSLILSQNHNIITINQSNVQRFAHRLKDKNPLIIEECIDKFINDKYFINKINKPQIFQMFIIYGYGSYYEKVKNKTIEYFKIFFMNCLKQQGYGQNNVQRNQNKQKHQLISIYNGIERFLVIIIKMVPDLFINRIHTCQMFIQLLGQIMINYIQKQISVKFVQIIYQKINNLYGNNNHHYSKSIISQEIIILFTIFKYIILHDNNNILSNTIQSIISQIKKLLINSANFPSPIHMIQYLKILIKQLKNNKNKDNINNKSVLTTIAYFIRTINIIIDDKLGLYDIVGKRAIFRYLQQMLSKQLCYVDVNFNNICNDSISNSDNHNYQYQINRLNKLINNSNQNSLNHMPIRNSFDLIPQILILMNKLIKNIKQQQITDIYKLTSIIQQLFNTKQLKFQYQLMQKTLINSFSINQQQNMNIHKIQLKQQIEKKLSTIKQKIQQKNYKALYILLSVSFIKQSYNNNINNCDDKQQKTKICPKLFDIKLYKYMEHIKLQLQFSNNSEIITNIHNKNNINNINKSYKDKFISFYLFYFACCQQNQSINQALKLYRYFALQKEGNQNQITELISLYLLAELNKIKSQSNKINESKNIEELINNINIKAFKIIRQQQMKDQNHSILTKKYQYLIEQLIKLIIHYICNSSIPQSKKVHQLSKIFIHYFICDKLQNTDIQYLIIITFEKLCYDQNIYSLVSKSLLIVVKIIWSQFEMNKQKTNFGLRLNLNTYKKQIHCQYLNKIIKLLHMLNCGNKSNMKVRINFCSIMFTLLQKDSKYSKYDNIISLIQLKFILPQFFYDKLKSNHNYQQVTLEQLIIFKKILQNLMSNYKNLIKCNKQKYLKYQDFLDDVQIIDQKVQLIIYKKVYKNKNNKYSDQQSISSQRQNDSSIQMVNSQKISIIQKNINNLIKEIQKQTDLLIKYLKQNDFVNILVKIFCSYKQYKSINNTLTQNSSNQRKQNKLQFLSDVQLQQQKQQKQLKQRQQCCQIILSQINTRSKQVKNMKRNIRIQQHFQQQQQQLASILSIRKYRFIIIPYDYIQQIQQKQKLNKKPRKLHKRLVSSRNKKNKQELYKSNVKNKSKSKMKSIMSINSQKQKFDDVKQEIELETNVNEIINEHVNQ